MRACVYCSRTAVDGLWLCETCATGLEKYADQNKVIVDAYVSAGIAAVELRLIRQIEFDQWLAVHPPTEEATADVEA